MSRTYRPRSPDISLGDTLPDPATDLPYPPGAQPISLPPFSAEPFGYPALTWRDDGIILDGPPGPWPAFVLHHPNGPDRTVQVWRRIVSDPAAGWTLTQLWTPEDGVTFRHEFGGGDSIERANAYTAALHLLRIPRTTGRPRGGTIRDPAEIVAAWHAVHETPDEDGLVRDRVTQTVVAKELHIHVSTLRRSLERLEYTWRESGPPVRLSGVSASY